LVDPDWSREQEEAKTMGDEVNEVSPLKREVSRRRFLHYAGAAASVPVVGALLDACGATSTTSAAAASFAQGKDPWPKHPTYKMAFINHVTTNPFFVPTRYGIADACTLLGCTYSWTGSTNSIPSQMVTAMDSAIAANVDGIAIPIISNTAFITPINRALAAGIPVVAYNASPTSDISANHYMSYVGQNNYNAGVALAQRLLADGAIKSGDLVGGMIATPGTANIQPRMDGAVSVLKPAGVTVDQVDTGALVTQEVTAVDAWYQGHTDAKFMFAVDDGSSDAVADCIKKYNLKGKVGGAGWDVGLPVLEGLKNGDLDYSVDQQAYLQGFIPTIQLFMYNISGGLMRPVDTDTGLTIVTRQTVGPYLATPTRFEGSTSTEKILTRPATISV